MTHHTTLDVKTTAREILTDITHDIEEAIRNSPVKEGHVVLFVPHTTAAITLNENTDPDVASDIIDALKKTWPENAGYRHAEGNSDAHIKASLIGNSEQLIIRDGRLVLGTWQGVYFCEFDGPRKRKLHMAIVGS